MKDWKKICLAVCILSAGSASAQNIESLEVELQDAQTGRKIVEVEQNRVAAPTGGIVILNAQNASQGASQAQSQENVQAQTQQPTTVVEASPLTSSRADEIRKARQGAEIQTETIIVEKLEESRLSDERRRAERLFGNRWDSVNQANQEQAPAVQQPQVVQPVQAAPQVIQVIPVQVEEKKEEKEIVEVDNSEKLEAAKSEIISEIRAQNLREQAKADLEKSTTYVGGILGMSEYSSVSNMQGNGAAGFSVGTLMPNGVIVEGSFMYSNYYIDEFWKLDYFKELDQFNFNLAVKYSPLKGMFRPLVGVTGGYTHRNYTDRTPGTFGAGVPDDEEISTSAVDAGILVGIDLALTDSFTIGTEYRYSRNLVNRSESDFLKRSDLRRPENSTPIEELDYYMLTLSGKFTF